MEAKEQHPDGSSTAAGGPTETEASSTPAADPVIEALWRCARRGCQNRIDETTHPNAGLDSPGRTRLGRPPLYCSDACRQAAHRAAAPEVARRCTECGQLKEPGEFYRGRQPCKTCTRARRRAYYHRAGGASASYAESVGRRFGLSLEQVEAMTAAQSGACAACGQVPTTRRRLHLDHDHTTGAVRGLLCHHCNIALGALGDDPARLLALLAYLARYNTTP